MHTFRTVAKASFGLPSPTWLLKVGAGFIGTETELLLKSRWVIPNRLQQAGYQFRFPEIKKALENLYEN